MVHMALPKNTSSGGDLTAMSEYLAGRICTKGPLSVAEFMAEALYHPKHGYYMTRDPFGRAGDFTTAPEISQMFGELIGAWCGERWQSIGRPETLHLIELGPGRGTLMADILRTTDVQPEFANAISIHLVEISTVLREQQRATLANSPMPVDGMHWHIGLETLPDGPLLVIANEFFDALPIHQFQRTATGWCERQITKYKTGFQFSLSSPSAALEALVPCDIHESSEVGAIFESRPEAISITKQIAARISRHGGAALFVDYGHEVSAVGDTLQAVRGHVESDILSDPGSADLTAHVDFGAIEWAASDLADVHGPTNQGDFLKRLGIAFRAEALARNATESVAGDIVSGHHRLVDSDQMGNLFKVMALTTRDMDAPPGFTDAP
jgi:NADH dehydrogenase [ubiquinone] 1 alpha subcomplex assembly factor 7